MRARAAAVSQSRDPMFPSNLSEQVTTSGLQRSIRVQVVIKG